MNVPYQTVSHGTKYTRCPGTGQRTAFASCSWGFVNIETCCRLQMQCILNAINMHRMRFSCTVLWCELALNDHTAWRIAEAIVQVQHLSLQLFIFQTDIYWTWTSGWSTIKPIANLASLTTWQPVTYCYIARLQVVILGWCQLQALSQYFFFFLFKSQRSALLDCLYKQWEGTPPRKAFDHNDLGVMKCF